MDLIRNAKVVTLRSRRSNKYLLACENEKSVTQGRNGSSRNEQWTVELVPYFPSVIRLKSCYNKYLTASDQHFLPGLKVLQTLPQTLDNSHGWEPIREGTPYSNQIKLKTHNDTFLRASRARLRSVTHARNANIQDGILWDVEIVEVTLEAATTYYYLSPPEARQKAVDFFNSMDTNHDGHVSIAEFVDFFSLFYSRMDCNFFAAFDENGDGWLGFPEVLRLHYTLTRPQARPFVESLTASIQQPAYAQNERFQRRLKTLLAFVIPGIQIATVASNLAM